MISKTNIYVYKPKVNFFFWAIYGSPTFLLSLILLVKLFGGLITVPLPVILFSNAMFWGLFLLVRFKTEYKIYSGHIHIKYAGLYYDQVSIDSIVAISTNAGIGLWMYALSTDGLRIRSRNKREIMLSPERQKDFLMKIKELNPTVVM